METGYCLICLSLRIAAVRKATNKISVEICKNIIYNHADLVHAEAEYHVNVYDWRAFDSVYEKQKKESDQVKADVEDQAVAVLH